MIPLYWLITMVVMWLSYATAAIQLGQPAIMVAPAIVNVILIIALAMRDDLVRGH